MYQIIHLVYKQILWKILITSQKWYAPILHPINREPERFLNIDSINYQNSWDLIIFEWLIDLWQLECDFILIFAVYLAELSCNR